MVCIENPPIVAASVDSLKRKLLQDLILPKVAFAQSSLPLPPVYTGTLVLPVNPRIRCAGRACRTNPAEELVMTCANSDCVTFAFCPLIGGNCRPNQRVIQTIAFSDSLWLWEFLLLF